MVIVQPSLADGDDFRMARQFAERRPQVGGRFRGVGGMPADGGVHGGKLFAKPDGARAAVEVGADGDDFVDASRLCAFNDLREVRRIIRIIQVGMGIDKIRQRVNDQFQPGQGRLAW